MTSLPFFLSQLRQDVQECSFIQAVFSTPLSLENKTSKITIRLIHTPKGVVYQLSKQIGQQIFHSNHSAKELVELLETCCLTEFKNGVVFTASADWHLTRRKEGDWCFKRKKATREQNPQPHNRLKNYVIEANQPIPFLIELGIMKNDGSIIPKMSHKFRQINRFIEFIAEAMPHLPKEGRLEIVDFGCGKSYLTFAVYYYIRDVLNRDVHIVGLDLKQEVIAACQLLASKLACSGLEFRVGNIQDYTPSSSLDMMICLHACDTATDIAIEKAVRWKTKVILAVPCCQHELYHQLQNEALFPLLKHGLLRERFASLVTDAARAMLLEKVGYQTQVVEFIDMEHTPKNVLIRAVYSKAEPSESLESAYRLFAETLHVHPTLERLL